jgi:ribA/ribD-fused uncharacterized protein
MNAERPDVTQKIMTATSPLDCKRLGDGIKLNPNEWLPAAKNILYHACMAKFTQNEDVKSFLKDTGDRTIIEASRDRIWGVGLGIMSNFLGNKSKWTGRNEMGEILMTVRGKINEISEC